MSALAIHLATRDRVKLWGKMIAGAFGPPDLGADELSEAPAEVQLVFAIQQSLGNCPKYLNKKQIIVRAPEPILLSESLPLPGSALELLAKADTFFITSHHEHTLGTNHRGGPPGFVRVAKNDAGGTVLVYPELSGNRLCELYLGFIITALGPFPDTWGMSHERHTSKTCLTTPVKP